MVPDEVMILAGWYGSIEEYLRGVVPAEMPASWPLAALMAQAIAAGGYVRWRQMHPHVTEDGRVIDVFVDARDQVFNPAMRDERTDLAVQNTAGIWIVDDAGEPVATRYVVRCGRPDCQLCQGQNGYDARTWDGRMCQHGARYLAELGMEHRQILRAYYGEVKFSDE